MCGCQVQLGVRVHKVAKKVDEAEDEGHGGSQQDVERERTSPVLDTPGTRRGQRPVLTTVELGGAGAGAGVTAGNDGASTGLTASNVVAGCQNRDVVWAMDTAVARRHAFLRVGTQPARRRRGRRWNCAQDGGGGPAGGPPRQIGQQQQDAGDEDQNVWQNVVKHIDDPNLVMVALNVQSSRVARARLRVVFQPRHVEGGDDDDGHVQHGEKHQRHRHRHPNRRRQGGKLLHLHGLAQNDGGDQQLGEGGQHKEAQLQGERTVTGQNHFGLRTLHSLQMNDKSGGPCGQGDMGRADGQDEDKLGEAAPRCRSLHVQRHDRGDDDDVENESESDERRPRSDESRLVDVVEAAYSLEGDVIRVGCGCVHLEKQGLD